MTFDAKDYSAEYQRRVRGRRGGNLDEVRSHLAMLAESGVYLSQIAAHTGLSYPGLVNLRNKATRVSQRVADTILSVSPEIAPDTAKVPIGRMVAVLDQLEARGWTRHQIGVRLGVKHGPQTDGRKFVLLGRVRRVAALLDEDPPGGMSERERLAEEAQRDYWRTQQRLSRQNRGMSVAALTDTFRREPWRDRAKCRDRNLTAVFFSSERHHVRRAKALCESCDVRGDCLDWALSTPTHLDFLGVAGGTTEDERVVLRRKAKAS